MLVCDGVDIVEGEIELGYEYILDVFANPIWHKEERNECIHRVTVDFGDSVVVGCNCFGSMPCKDSVAHMLPDAHHWNFGNATIGEITSAILVTPRHVWGLGLEVVEELDSVRRQE